MRHTDIHAYIQCLGGEIVEIVMGVSCESCESGYSELYSKTVKKSMVFVDRKTEESSIIYRETGRQKAK